MGILNTPDGYLDDIACKIYEHIVSLQGGFYTYQQMISNWSKFKKAAGHGSHHFDDGDKLFIWTDMVACMNGIRGEGLGNNTRLQYRKDLAKMKVLTNVTSEERLLFATAVIEFVQNAGPEGINKIEAMELAFDELKMRFDTKTQQKHFLWIARRVVTSKTKIIVMPTDETRWIYKPSMVTAAQPSQIAAPVNATTKATRKTANKNIKAQVHYMVSVFENEYEITPGPGKMFHLLFGNEKMIVKGIRFRVVEDE